MIAVDEKEFIIDIDGFKVAFVETIDVVDFEVFKFVYAYDPSVRRAICCEQYDDKFYWWEDGYPLKKKPDNALIIERALALFNLIHATKKKSTKKEKYAFY